MRLVFGALFAAAAGLAAAPPAAAAGPELEITSLKIVDTFRGKRMPPDRVAYEYVLKNVGDAPVPGGLVLQAFASRTAEYAKGSARPAGGWGANECAKLGAGQTCTGRYPANRHGDEYPFLIVKAFVPGAEDLEAFASVPFDSPAPPPPGPTDLRVSDLSLVEKSADALTYRCTVRNVGPEPIEPAAVALRAKRALDEVGRLRASEAGAAELTGDGPLRPGEARVGTYRAAIEADTRGYLIVEAAFADGAADPTPDDNRAAIPLDAPLGEVTNPSPIAAVPPAAAGADAWVGTDDPTDPPAAGGPRLEIVALELREPMLDARPGPVPYRVRVRNAGAAALPPDMGLIRQVYLTENADGTGRSVAAGRSVRPVGNGLEPDVAVVMNGAASRIRAGDGQYAGLKVEVRVDGVDGLSDVATIPLDGPKVAALAADLRIDTLVLTARTPETVTWRATLRNRGEAPLELRDRVIVQTYASPDAAGGAGAEELEFAEADACRRLEPDATCEVTGTARRPGDGGLPFLVLKAGRPPVEAGWDDAAAIRFDALDEPPAAPTAAPAPQARAAAGNDPLDWLLGGLCVGFLSLFFLGIAGFFGVAIHDAVRPERRFPAKYRALPEDRGVRRGELARLAEQLGFKPLDFVPPELDAALAAEEVSNVLRRRTRAGTWYLCDTERTTVHRSSSSGDSSSHSRSWAEDEYHTALIFLAADGTKSYPPFVASPNYHPHAVMMKLHKRLFGVGAFSEDPEFDRTMLLATVAAGAVRPLMSERVRDLLKEHAPLTVRADGPGDRRAGRGCARSAVARGASRTTLGRTGGRRTWRFTPATGRRSCGRPRTW